jgi:hypothetical protein
VSASGYPDYKAKRKNQLIAAMKTLTGILFLLPYRPGKQQPTRKALSRCKYRHWMGT